MSTEMRGKNRSFAEILEGFSSEKHEAPYQNGADLGLGLLNELYFAFKKYSRVPKSKPQSREQERQDPPKGKVEVKPLKPWSSAEKTAIAFFVSNGELEPGSLKDVKKSFRRLARQFHPDSAPDATESERMALNVKFRQLRQAYSCLEKHFTSTEAHSESKAAA